MTGTLPIDIPELMKVDLATQLAAGSYGVPSGGIRVGETTDAQNQAGCIAIAEAGASEPELYAPLIHGRIQVRCIAPRLADAQAIGRAVWNAWHKVDRRTATATADGHTYLIHGTNCVAGPSQHYDTQETWEYLLFFSVMVGTQYVS